MKNPVMHWQILAKDPEKCAQFYTALFGWTVTAGNAMGYRMVDTGAGKGINGGIWPCPPQGQSMVSLYIEVEDVGAHVASCRALGGSVAVEPQQLPEGGEMAVVIDPEGVPVGLFGPGKK